MAKATPDAVLDKMLDEIATATRMVACSAQPTSFTEANGDSSGRKLTVAAKSSVLIDATGSATHIALVRVADSTLLYVTTCTTQSLTANGSNTVNIPAWDIEIADPS